MAAKHFTLRRAGLSLCLFLSVFLMAFSCQDHVVPTNPTETSLKTLNLKIISFFGQNFLEYEVQFSDLGQVPIVEHGVVRVLANLDQGAVVPTIADTKVISGNAPGLQAEKFNEAIGMLLIPKRIFYRAYALLENGNVIYGEVKDRLNISDNPTNPTIATLDAQYFPNGTTFGLQLALGSVPVTEYGILYSTGNSVTPPQAPTEGNNKLVFAAAPTLNPVHQTKQINDFSFFIYYRAYAKLLNGDTIFGETKTVGTTTQ